MPEPTVFTVIVEREGFSTYLFIGRSRIALEDRVVPAFASSPLLRSVVAVGNGVFVHLQMEDDVVEFRSLYTKVTVPSVASAIWPKFERYLPAQMRRALAAVETLSATPYDLLRMPTRAEKLTMSRSGIASVSVCGLSVNELGELHLYMSPEADLFDGHVRMFRRNPKTEAHPRLYDCVPMQSDPFPVLLGHRSLIRRSSSSG